MHYNNSSLATWYAKRHICAPARFSSYFRLSIGDDTLPKRLVRDLLENACDEEYVREFFRARSRTVRKNGKSEVPLVFDELMGLTSRIPGKKLIPLLAAIFEIFDEIDLRQDEERGGFNLGNQLRMQWLLNELVRDKLSQTQRNVLFRKIFPKASFEWSIDLMRRIHNEQFPRAPENETPTGMQLVGAEVAADLRAATIERIRESARTGDILKSRHLLSVLYRWRDFLRQDLSEVQMWTSTQLDNDEFLFRLIEAVTSTVWRSSIGWDGMGDRVSQGVPYVQLEGLESILDIDRFLVRVEEVENIMTSGLNDGQKLILQRYREGVRQRESEGRGGAPSGST